MKKLVNSTKNIYSIKNKIYYDGVVIFDFNNIPLIINNHNYTTEYNYEKNINYIKLTKNYSIKIYKSLCNEYRILKKIENNANFADIDYWVKYKFISSTFLERYVSLIKEISNNYDFIIINNIYTRINKNVIEISKLNRFIKYFNKESRILFIYYDFNNQLSEAYSLLKNQVNCLKISFFKY